MKIRPATPGDYDTFARLMPELGVPDVVPPADRWWNERAPTTLFAERDGAAVGYAYYEMFDGILYVRNVVSAPEARRTGVGRTLMSELEAIARQSGARAWQLNVKDDNVAAIELYRSFGFEVEYATHVLVVRWDIADQLGRSRACIVRPAEPERDAELESGYALATGFIDRRRRSGAHILVAETAGARSGLAVFDPSFPGAYPFRASSNESARALLEAMSADRVDFSHGEAWQREGAQLVVEDDVRLAETLLDAGAELRFRVLNMRATH